MARGAFAQADQRPAPAVEPPAEASQDGLPPMDPDCRGAEDFGGTELERAAYCAVIRGRFVSGRTLADRALEADPASFRAHFAMGYAQHIGEANLPKALFHLERAEEGFEARYGQRPDKAVSPWRAYYRILLELLYVHGEMDHHEEKIRYADAIGERLDIDYSARKAWPLLKLERFDEARRIAKAAAESEDEWNRAVGLTGLCAVESEARNRQAAYEACTAAARPVLRSRSDGAVELSNAGAAAEEMFAFDEAERYYLEATRRRPEGSVNPWGRLVRLYLRQGRFAEALSGWRNMREYRRARAGAHMDQQDQSESDLVGAAVLLVAGRPDDAEPITARTVDRPDRQGTSSAASDQNEAGAAIMDRVAKLGLARMYEEEATVAPVLDALELRARALLLRYRAWQSGRRAAEVLAKPERLYTTLRPECPGSIELPSWLDAEVIELVGPGVALSAIEVAREEETLPPEQAEQVFLALEAEAHWRAGDDAEALAAAERALERLPASEAMHRARVAAIGAAAAEAEGDLRRARELYTIVMTSDPSVIRRLGLSLPVKLVSLDPAPEVEEALDALESSPRLSIVDWGFELQVGLQEVRLVSPEGSVITSARVVEPAPEPEPDAEPAEDEVEADEDDPPPLPDTLEARIVRTVHRSVLAPEIDITQADVRSLDGSLGTGGRASDRVRSILDEVEAEP